MPRRAQVKGFVFGSATRPNFRWTDVDILIVYSDDRDASDVRKVMAPVCAVTPIDLLMISSAEESELNFVAEQKCRLLFDLAASNVRS
jgi:hypothetical protein